MPSCRCRRKNDQKVSKNSEKVAELLRLEAAAIERAAECLDEQSVDAAIAALQACRGKAVVMGVGKSGVIAQKIAQTMTSTGTVAMFLHPSDALHGSLGLVSEGDVVLALSNSGETEELLAILPALKRRKVTLIAIVGNVSSTLANNSHIVLDAAVDKEACPLNLAPTTSTTVALAVGDAIAMALMESRGITPEDFAANHPAGQLGKRLTMTAADLMHPSPNITADRGWLEVVKAISSNGLGAVTVVDSDGLLIGIVTDGDLRRTIEGQTDGDLRGLSARDMMTRGPIAATAETLAFDALRVMEDRPSQISVLPVTDDGGKCIGLLRLHDIVRSGL